MPSSWFIVDGLGARRPARLSAMMAEGAAGTIHRVIGEPGVVVKLYKNPQDLPEYREKIAAMLAAPPQLPAFQSGRQNYVQIAWPTANVIDDRGGFRGFAMPEVDFQASSELQDILQRAMRQIRQLPEFYGGRVLLAANLAALMAELHAVGHYMIDMKPMNMRFYPSAWYMAILDTDGFSINGPRRLPARQFSDDYIAPELRGQKPEQLGLGQDLFALAVIIFQLLNNGIHPFQGIDLGHAQQPTTLQERIFSGLYAYGVSPNRLVAPTASSIHDYLEDETRALFDRAFIGGGARPTAGDWRTHLKDLITNRVLVRCVALPRDHAHFSKGCGLCAVQQLLARGRSGTHGKPVQSPASLLSTLPTASRTSGSFTPHAQYTTRPPARRFRLSSWKLALGYVGISALALVLYSVWPREQHSTPRYVVPRVDTPAVANTGMAPPSLTNYSLCSYALTSDKTAWDRSPSYAYAVTEAQRRGFTLEYCQIALRGAAPTPPPQVTPPTQLTPPPQYVPPQPTPAPTAFSLILSGAQGRWTTSRTPTDCQSHYYNWYHGTDWVRFEDESGGYDQEAILEISNGSMLTETRESVHPRGAAESIGTRWVYSLEQVGRIQVQNLSKGRNFSLIKCADN